MTATNPPCPAQAPPRVRRRAGAVVACALLLLTGCTTSDQVAAEPNRSTVEVDGTVYYLADCTHGTIHVSGVYGDLPKKGMTSRERVESLLPAARAALIPNALAVTMVPRNGEVWDGSFDGDHVVESVADYQYEVVLHPGQVCPPPLASWHGIPLLHRRTATLPFSPEPVSVPHLIGLTVAEARQVSAPDLMVDAVHTAGLDDAIIVEQIPWPGMSVPSGTAIHVETTPTP